MKLDEKSKSYVSHGNLHQLFWLRSIAIAAQSGAVASAVFYFQMDLPIVPIIFSILVLTIFNVYTRIRINRDLPILPYELLLQLLVDIGVLTVLLALSGGATNPFAILYLLPLTIAAIILPNKMTWLLVVLAIVSYSLLMFFYIPLPVVHNHGSEFSLHVFGMWLGFVLSAVVIAYFVVGLRNLIRRQSESLRQVEEETIRNEHLVKLGVLAASTAHDLGTPLNTMALLLEDLECDETNANDETFKTTKVLREQIERCRNALATLTQSSGNVSLEGGSKVLLTEYIQNLLSTWQLGHSAINIDFDVNEKAECPSIIADKILDHALINIVDNAAEATLDKIKVHLSWDEQCWSLVIRDFGAGITDEEKDHLGLENYTTKPHGLGLGLFLTKSIIKRLGGTVDFSNHEEGGLCVKAQLPIQLFEHEKLT